MHLFAIVSGITPRVQRIALQQPVQTEVHALFKAQATRFLKDASFVGFQGGFSPESDEILQIAPFQDPLNLIEIAKDPLACPVLTITDDVIGGIDALYTLVDIEGEASACIQAFDRRNALTKGRFTLIDFGDGFRRLEKTGMTLSTTLIMILQKNRLLFKSYHQAGRVYDLADYFHEATSSEVAEFAKHVSIATPDESDFVELSSTPRIRKQIALVIESKILDSVPVKKIVSKAKGFKLKIPVIKVGGKERIVLPQTRPELKDVLDWLLENYYKGVLTKKPFVSNSKRSAQ